jgi:hypothetical protein
MIGEREGTKYFSFVLEIAIKIEERLAVSKKKKRIKDSSITNPEYSSVPPTRKGIKTGAKYKKIPIIQERQKNKKDNTDPVITRASSMLLDSYSENIGIKDWESVPSASKFRNILGSLYATEKAEATIPVPKLTAIK